VKAAGVEFSQTACSDPISPPSTRLTVGTTVPFISCLQPVVAFVAITWYVSVVLLVHVIGDPVSLTGSSTGPIEL